MLNLQNHRLDFASADNWSGFNEIMIILFIKAFIVQQQNLYLHFKVYAMYTQQNRVNFIFNIAIIFLQKINQNLENSE